MHNMICVTLVCIQGKYLTCCWSVKCLGLLKTFTLGFTNTINVVNVKLCMVVLLIELYLFVPLSLISPLWLTGLKAPTN